MSQRLLARVREIEGFNTQISSMSQIIAEKDKKNEIFKAQIKELKKLTKGYSSDLRSRIKALERYNLQIHD